MSDGELIRRIEAFRQALEEIATGKITGGSTAETLDYCRRIARETLEGDEAA